MNNSKKKPSEMLYVSILKNKDLEPLKFSTDININDIEVKINADDQRDLHRIAKSEKNTKPLQELIPQSILCSATYLRFCHLLTQQSHLDQEKLIFDMLHEKIAVMEGGHFRTAPTNCRDVAGLMSRF